MKFLQPAELGYAVRSKLADAGAGARLFFRLVASLGAVSSTTAVACRSSVSLRCQKECLPIGKDGHMSPIYREVSSGGTTDHFKRRASPSGGVAGRPTRGPYYRQRGLCFGMHRTWSYRLVTQGERT